VIKDLAESLSNSIKERITSPLLGAYTVALLFSNWQVLVILFTSKGKGFQLIDELNLVYQGPEKSLIYPLIFALGFSAIYPITKAVIGALGSMAKYIDLVSEGAIESVKQRMAYNRSRNDQVTIDGVIKQLEGLYAEDRIGYHELKRILDVLPREEDLIITRKREGLIEMKVPQDS
jgi:hypothetical protein